MAHPTSTPPLDLLLFRTDPDAVAEATRAGVSGFIVDWELRGKERRQAGEGTEINHDTLADLERVRAATDAHVVCRLNHVGHWTRREVESAVDAGADEVLVPMVRTAREVDRVLEWARERAGVGILIETRAGVAAADELCRRPLSRVYVGLNDLRIDRGSSDLFRPLVDGTVERVRDAAGVVPFGVAGLTLPDSGSPVPSRLLAAELVRLDARFTFLRRSFRADTRDLPVGVALLEIRDHLRALAGRTERLEDADRAELVRLLGPSAEARTA